LHDFCSLTEEGIEIGIGIRRTRARGGEAIRNERNER